MGEKLHNEQVHKLCSSPDIIKISKDNNIGGAYHTVFIIDMGKQYTLLIGKSSGQKCTESPTCRPYANIQIGLTETGGRKLSKLIGSG
jgi:hypothetical protein